MTEDEIRKLFAKFDAELFKKDVWTVQNATVIKHSALERLAAAAGIKFDQPQVIRAERDEAVILATGHLGDRSEWSIGEALINMNYRVSGKQAGYVYAMAEKRAKDRVIIKLANLHGLYSEDEADEFKEQSPSAPMPGRNAPVSSGTKPAHSETGATLSEAANGFLLTMKMSRCKADLREWYEANKFDMRASLSEVEVAHVIQERNKLGFTLPEFLEAAE